MGVKAIFSSSAWKCKQLFKVTIFQTWEAPDLSQRSKNTMRCDGNPQKKNFEKSGFLNYYIDIIRNKGEFTLGQKIHRTGKSRHLIDVHGR
ncbi:hypothetical protein UR09_04385, partial [Candidatus Nitromaritima sp. SCGC AAA799-A02]